MRTDIKAVLPPDTLNARSTRSRFNVIVIGAGHNGLTAAGYLARSGKSVLALERRAVVGGAAVTEEVAPGRSVSSCSYIASMLLPKVIKDLELDKEGLTMTPCDPSITIACEDGGVLRWWADPHKTAGEIARISPRDAKTFLEVDAELKALARYLQPFFLENPPNIAGAGLDRMRSLMRVARRFARISGPQTAALTEFMTGSLGDFLDTRFEAQDTKRLFLANNVYGKHGGPYDPGTAMGLLFHLLSGGEDDIQGYSGHVIGGMGSISNALARAAMRYGAEIRTSSPVAQIVVENGKAIGVRLESGELIEADVILSNADPKATFLHLTPDADLPEIFRKEIATTFMNGPSAKLNLALSAEPVLNINRPANAGPAEKSVFTMAPPSLQAAQHCYDQAKLGDIPRRLWIDVVIPTYVDPTLAPEGDWMATCFIQYVPYHLREGDWEQRRDEFASQAIDQLSEVITNLPEIMIAHRILTPLDLERTYGLTEGNIFHGDLRLDQLFFMRPTPECSQYRTPVDGLYLCGAGAHPGGGVTGAPGHNAAQAVLRDMRA